MESTEEKRRRREENAPYLRGGREHAPDEVGAPGGAAAEAVDGFPHRLERRRGVDLRPAPASVRPAGRSRQAFGLGAHGEWQSWFGARRGGLATGERRERERESFAVREREFMGRRKQLPGFISESRVPASETLTGRRRSRCALVFSPSLLVFFSLFFSRHRSGSGEALDTAPENWCGINGRARSWWGGGR